MREFVVEIQKSWKQGAENMATVHNLPSWPAGVEKDNFCLHYFLTIYIEICIIICKNGSSTLGSV